MRDFRRDRLGLGGWFDDIFFFGVLGVASLDKNVLLVVRLIAPIGP